MVSGSQRRRRCEWCENRYANIKLTNAQNVTSVFLSAACEAIFTWVSSSNKNNFFEGYPFVKWGACFANFENPQQTVIRTRDPGFQFHALLVKVVLNELLDLIHR